MKAGYKVTAETRRRALLTTQKVRQAIADSVTPWSESEQRIAVALIKFLTTGEPSKLLVRRITHVITNDRPRAQLLNGDIVMVSWVELDAYVGLRPEQQELIERAYAEACDSPHVTLDPQAI